MAEAAPSELDFYIDADDAYEPRRLPTGVVKMGGTKYMVRCPKDSLPILLGRIERRAKEAPDAAAQEEIITQLLSACFEQEDVPKIVERVISPYERQLSIAFLVDTVQRVYQKYAPFLDREYEELGIENPVKQPQDRLPSSKKPKRPKAVAAKKAPGELPPGGKPPVKKTAKRAVKKTAAHV